MADFNPTTMATNLAKAYTQPLQALLDTQTQTASSTGKALSKLQSALQAFDSAMKGLSGKGSLSQMNAQLDSTTLGTATATSAAIPGSYQVFVERLATAHQIAFQDLPAVPAGPGAMTVKLAGGSAFNVDMASADTDGNGTLSQTEIARAINAAPDNKGQVTAMVLTSAGKTQLVLSAVRTGAANQISLDTRGLSGPLRTALDDPSKQLTLSAAQDAVVWMGAPGTGLRIQQDSNSLTSIPGVTLTLKSAMKPGDPPANLSVSKDDSGTAANVKSFVDAYNVLEKALDDLTSSGSAKDGVAAAALANDAGIRGLRSRIGQLLRQSSGGVSLAQLGVTADRSGNLSLDSNKLSKALAAKPGALDAVFGQSSFSSKTGVLGGFSVLVDQWTNSRTGQIPARQTTLQNQQKALSDRQTRLNTQYDAAYSRYLKQFTDLQNLQSQMNQTSGLFGSLSN